MVSTKHEAIQANEEECSIKSSMRRILAKNLQKEEFQQTFTTPSALV